MKEILISIITVCYNSEKTIERTIRSVLEQTYDKYEYLIIDGCSKDRTLEIVKSYEASFGGRMKIISEPDQGIYDAMNKGISLTKGQLIGMINSDDYYEKDALEVMAEEYHSLNSQYGILYGFQRNFDHGREVSTVMYHHDYLEQQMITHPTCFVTPQVYRDFGTFNLKYKSSADYEFMLRMFDSKKVEFRPVYKIITNFAFGGMSASQTGYRETLQLLYKRGKLPRGKYYKTMIKSCLYQLIHGS